MFFSFADKNPLQDLGKGLKLKVLGGMQNLDAIHWNLDDKTVLKGHQHPQEQFGYVISGSLEATVGNDTAILKAGGFVLHTGQYLAPVGHHRTDRSDRYVRPAERHQRDHPPGRGRGP